MGMTDNLPFVKAKYFTETEGRVIRVIVIHDMEAPENKNTAENCAVNFQITTRPSSAHICVDNDSAVRCVLDKDVAYQAPGCNSDGLGIEHAGYASQDRGQWQDDYSKAMLNRSAGLVADWCSKYHIPAKKLTVSELLAGEKGIVGHADVTAAYHKSDHTDPGVGFPWDIYMASVAAELGKINGKGPIPNLTKTNPTAAETEQVKKLQTAAHQNPDGKWGTDTDTALKTIRAKPIGQFDVKLLQGLVGANPDGDWGDISQKAYIATIKNIQQILGVSQDGDWGSITDGPFYALRQKAYLNF
jgi:N-acetyl-anhydromuramyl-L-alanine amidase AmpD